MDSRPALMKANYFWLPLSTDIGEKIIKRLPYRQLYTRWQRPDLLYSTSLILNYHCNWHHCLIVLWLSSHSQAIWILHWTKRQVKHGIIIPDSFRCFTVVFMSTVAARDTVLLLLLEEMWTIPSYQTSHCSSPNGSVNHKDSASY